MRAGTGAPPPHVLLDSTLRDGEQAAGVVLTPEEKAEYVRLAESVGVRYIEVGFPQNNLDFEAARAAARAARHARLVAMAVTTRASVEMVAEIGAHEVLFVVPCSASHLRDVYDGDVGELAARLAECIGVARGRGLGVNVGLEDASQGDVGLMNSLVAALRPHAGAIDCLTVADTRGQQVPTDAVDLVRWVRQESAASCRFAYHAHNDLGLATANSLAVLSARPPADCVHVTTCGFGERAGNASLEQVAILLDRKLGWDHGLDLRRLPALTAFVEEAFLTPLGAHAPVVGSKVFAHESGIHQKGMLRDVSTYQYLSPETLGREVELVLGKHSGRRLRAVFAELAGCREEEVWALQCRLATPDKRKLRESFRALSAELRQVSYLALRCPEAIAALRAALPVERPRGEEEG